MVPQVVRNGPNTHVIIDTNPPINRPVGWSRSISTFGSVPPTGEHGRYRRSVRLHLRRITVDRGSSIIDRDNFVIGWTDDTCGHFSFAEKTEKTHTVWQKPRSVTRIEIGPCDLWKCHKISQNVTLFQIFGTKLCLDRAGVDGRGGKKEKNKNYSWYLVQGPGRMAQMPQAATGDSLSRFRRYHCSDTINYDS